MDISITYFLWNIFSVQNLYKIIQYFPVISRDYNLSALIFHLPLDSDSWEAPTNNPFFPDPLNLKFHRLQNQSQEWQGVLYPPLTL